MKISKSIILPEFESIESLDQASNILHKITEAMKDHQIQNYDDSVANFRRVTTGRIQSQDGETYFDLDSGVIRGEIVFRKGSSGLDNIEEASPGDWDNAFRLANAVCGDSDFTLISGGKIITNSIAAGAFNLDVTARMFSSGDSQDAIEAWMKAGHITYIDGNKIYTGSILAGSIAAGAITAGKISVTSLDAITATLGTVSAGLISGTRFRVGGGTNEDIYFEDSAIRMYDAVSGNYKRIYWKYGAVNFARLSYLSTSGHSWFYLVSGAYDVHLTQQGNSSTLRTSGYRIEVGAGSNEVAVYDTGQFKIQATADAPTQNNYGGDLICDQYGQLHIYTTAWRHINSYAGW